jgi:hypothetical protein
VPQRELAILEELERVVGVVGRGSERSDQRFARRLVARLKRERIAAFERMAKPLIRFA